MKTTIITIITLALASSSLAATATVRRDDPSTEDVTSSVQSQLQDVMNVNSFLDDASKISGDDLTSVANTILSFASDEPVEFGILCSLNSLSSDGQNACSALRVSFQTGMINQLNNIIDGSNAPTAVEVISETRCIIVLPSWILCGLLHLLRQVLTWSLLLFQGRGRAQVLAMIDPAKVTI